MRKNILFAAMFLSLCLWVGNVYAQSVDHRENLATGIRVMGFLGQKLYFEVSVDSVAADFKIQHRIATTWTDFYPPDDSVDDYDRVYAFSDGFKKQFTKTFAIAPDSTRILINTDAETDVRAYVQ